MKKKLGAILLVVALAVVLGLVPAISVGAAGPVLVGLWHFDEGSGATTVADSSGNGNTGTVVGATTGVAGKFGNALSFDGSNDYVDLGTSLKNDLSSVPATLEVWVKGSFANGNQIVFGDYTSKIGLGFYVSGGVNYFIVKVGTSAADAKPMFNVSGVFVNDVWNHIVVTYDASANSTFWLNGAQITTTGVNQYWVWATDVAEIGRRSTTPSYTGTYFKGVIDEVRIWNSALTDPQLEKHPVTYVAVGNALPVTVPADEWVDYGGTATGVFPSPVTDGLGTQDVFVNDDRPLTITGPTTITGTYQTQYLLTSLSPATIWVGLKNSDDVGTKFDLKAEVYNGAQLVGSGEALGVSGGSSGFNNAVKSSIALTPVPGAYFLPGDTLSIRLSVRIATSVSGHRSGTARLWFNDSQAKSNFDATIGGVSQDYFLRNGLTLTLNNSVGSGPKKTIDVFVDKLVGGNPFKPFGTWSITLP